MAFGSTFTQKPRKPETVRPLTGALVRIVLLAALASAAAAWGIYLYYTHAFRPKSRPVVVDGAAPRPGEIEIDLSPSSSASP